MNAHRFDAWTKTLSATATSRRLAVRLLGGVTLGGLLGAGAEDAAARCIRLGRKCERGERCCGEGRCRARRCRCPRGRKPCGNTCCPVGLVCAGGRCRCPAGGTICSGQCRDLATDPQRCGACTTVCREDEVCTNGACACPDALTDCAGVCVSLAGDPDNCGACGFICTPNESCRDGGCCTRIGRSCATSEDRCCGASFCQEVGATGTFACCGITGVSSCATGATCCSGRCGPTGRCA